jgi:hypothetical protein
MIAHWKGIIEEIHFGGPIMPFIIIENLNLEKTSFRPSKWPRKFKPTKNSKLSKLPENYFEPFGKGGWPPIYMNLLRLRLFNNWIYMRGQCVEGIFALCCSLVDLLLLDIRCLGKGCSGCSVLLFSF